MGIPRASAGWVAGVLLWLALIACGSTGTDAVGADSPGDGVDSVQVTDRRVDLTSARGVSVTIVVSQPAEPRGAVLLFEGGDGRLNVGGTAEDPTVGSRGFLARNVRAFAERGLLAVLIDVPSDRAAGGIDPLFRQGAAHAQDIEAVLGWVEHETSAPVWVVGMSLGSFSAVNTAIRLGARLGGCGLASALTAARGALAQTNPRGILDMDVARIALPAVVVGHEDDACPDTPPSGVAAIVAALGAADPVGSRLFAGGEAAQSPACGPLSPHGFFGVDEEVVSFLADFIEAH